MKLIIEVDGSIHDLPDIKELDETRQQDLQKWGYTIMRFTNKEVMEKPEEVVRMISERILKNFTKTNDSVETESKNPL